MATRKPNTKGSKKAKTVVESEDEVKEEEDWVDDEYSWLTHDELFFESASESKEKIGINFWILHFLLMYPITGYKLGQTFLYLGLLSIQQFLVKGFSYLAPILLGYINVHLGAIFIASNFLKGPLEEREGIAAIYGRIIYLLLRTKELEWIKDNISNTYLLTDPDVTHSQTNMNAIIQWSIVLVFLAVPRGIILAMYGFILAIFTVPLNCNKENCGQEEELEYLFSGLQRLYALVAQYFTFSKQLECITALVAYCTGMTILLYLARYTRFSGQTLQELMILLFGGFGLLAVKPFIGIMMALFSICLTNSEFYKGVILGEERELLGPTDFNQPTPSGHKEDPKVDKNQELKKKLIRMKNATLKKTSNGSEVDDILVEFLPYKVPEPAQNESFFPTGRGGISWNSVMAIMLSVYYPYYDYALSTKMKLSTHSYKYATILVTVVHPIVVSA